jgi:hypothetical protein
MIPPHMKLQRGNAKSLLIACALVLALGAIVANGMDEVEEIARVFEWQPSTIEQIQVRYHFDKTQLLSPEELDQRTRELRQRLGMPDRSGHAGPLPFRVDCLWAKSNQVEYLETKQHFLLSKDVGEQVLHEKRLVEPERTTLWRAPEKEWNQRLRGDFATVLITPQRGANWIPGYRFARFFGEDEHGHPLAESLVQPGWAPSGRETVAGARLHKLRLSDKTAVGNYTEMWFDESRGFTMVRRIVVDGGNTATDLVVEKSREVIPGVWAPLAMTEKRFWHGTGEPLDVTHMVVEDIKINGEVPTEALELKWDRGSSVVDEIKGVKYREGLSSPESISR